MDDDSTPRRDRASAPASRPGGPRGRPTWSASTVPWRRTPRAPSRTSGADGLHRRPTRTTSSSPRKIVGRSAGSRQSPTGQTSAYTDGTVAIQAPRTLKRASSAWATSVSAAPASPIANTTAPTPARRCALNAIAPGGTCGTPLQEKSAVPTRAASVTAAFECPAAPGDAPQGLAQDVLGREILATAPGRVGEGGGGPAHGKNQSQLEEDPGGAPGGDGERASLRRNEHAGGKQPDGQQAKDVSHAQPPGPADRHREQGRRGQREIGRNRRTECYRVQAKGRGRNHGARRDSDCGRAQPEGEPRPSSQAHVGHGRGI